MKEKLEHTILCLNAMSKGKQYKVLEYYTVDGWGGNFAFELIRLNENSVESLSKYLCADQGYHTLDSAREEFIFNFIPAYINAIDYDKTTDSK